MASPSDPSLRTDSTGFGAWALLFGILCAAGGHGVFLLAAIWQELERGDANDLGAAGFSRFLEVLVNVGQGRLGALAIAWLLVAPLLALAVLPLRRTLMQTRWLAMLVLVAVLVTAGAFALYMATAASRGGAPS